MFGSFLRPDGRLIGVGIIDRVALWLQWVKLYLCLNRIFLRLLVFENIYQLHLPLLLPLYSTRSDRSMVLQLPNRLQPCKLQRFTIVNDRW